ncbi:MAG: hypothetical protein M3Q07_15525 [Pseudobdellovibrionaceae bacterium]|nr:hypothetical protein [Pseudobdellovibrionaceae bacterium]
MAEFLVTVPELRIIDTYVEAQKSAHAAKRVIDEHDNEELSLHSDILVIVLDERGDIRKYIVRGKRMTDGTIKNSAEETNS